MEQFKQFAKEHRTLVLVALFFLIVFIGGSAMSAVNVANLRAADAAQQAEQAAGGTNTKQDGDSSDVPLTDSQKDAVKNYDETTQEFIDTLSAIVWSANSGNYTLRFSEDQYIETVNGESEQHSYAVLRLEQGNDTAGNKTATAVVETDTGTHILEYTNMTGSRDDGSDVVTTVLSSGSMFALKDTNYERGDAVANIDVKGLNSEVTDLLGGDAKKLTSELSKWVAVHYPTASEATWSGSAFIDWENSFISLDFTLNGDTNATVSAIYHMDTGSYEFDG